MRLLSEMPADPRLGCRLTSEAIALFHSVRLLSEMPADPRSGCRLTSEGLALFHVGWGGCLDCLPGAGPDPGALLSMFCTSISFAKLAEKGGQLEKRSGSRC